jgi:ATP-dependent helicase/nuclease subunit A
VAAAGDDGEKRGAEEIRREEARLIAARIRLLCAFGAPHTVHDEEGGGWRTARPGDIALLFRSTSSLYLYEEALRAAGIDFIATAGSGFHRRQEILDVINLLRVIVNPRDAAALAAFLRSPIGCMSDEGLLLLAGTRGLLRAFLGGDAPDSLSSTDAEALARARALLGEARARKHSLLPELLAWIYERTQIEAIALDHHYGLQKASNLRKLLALAADFSAQGRPPLERFVRYVAQVAENDALREGEALMQPLGGGAVTLMTIHKSKGLEFPVVFVCDMGQAQQDPRETPLFLHRDLGWALRGANARGESFVPAMAKTISTRQANRNEAESARLLYVAMTRARDVLVLCGKEKPGKGSWFAMVDGVWPVCDSAEGATFSGAWGGLVVRRALASAARVARADDALTVEALAAALASAGQSVPAAPAPQVLSITALLDLIGGADADAEEPEIADDVPEGAAPGGDEARRRGTLVHALLERWEFAHAEAPIEETLRDAGIGLSEVGALFARNSRRWRGARGRCPALRSLAAARRIQRELPFTWRVGSHTVRGTIDALVEASLIVDYKTGRRTPEKDARYALQLQLYALALDDIDGAAARSARLLYVDDHSELAVDCSHTALEALRTQLERVLHG